MMIIVIFKLKGAVNAIEHLAWSLTYYKRSMAATTIITNTVFAIFKGYL